MSPPQTVKLLEQCDICPSPASLPPTSLPLTFFDIPWLLFPPSLPLFFYQCPHSTTHFTHTTLPILKRSLSLTLHHFFPFAGNLVTSPNLGKPNFLYIEGDSIPLTVAESNADFDNLCGHHPRYVEEFHPLVPQLGELNETQKLPLLAVQITIFPNSGISIGLSYRHVVADGRTFDHFLKFWATVSRCGVDLSALNKLTPCHDRALINEPDGLKDIFLKEWRELKSLSNINTIETQTLPGDMVRASFVVRRNQMEGLKQRILSKCRKKNYSESLLLSPYVVTCALAWICLIKARRLVNKLHYFGFIAGGIPRLDYTVPANYFGNCVAFGRSMAVSDELLGEDGLVIAAKAIGDKIKKLNAEVLGDAETWISEWRVLLGSELHTVISGSPKVDLYGLDFGWGKPRKIEDISIDSTGAVSLSGSREGDGGIEVGLSLPKAKMDVFGSLFASGFDS